MIRRCTIALLLVAPILISASTPLTIVAPAAPGGGWDQTARVMQRVLAAIEPGASVQVDNVPGAAGTIGLARFVQSERGNPHALLVTGLVMVSGVITNHSPVSLADATPIARLTGETEVIVSERAARQAWLEARGYKVIGMTVADVERELETELAKVEASLNSSS